MKFCSFPSVSNTTIRDAGIPKGRQDHLTWFLNDLPFIGPSIFSGWTLGLYREDSYAGKVLEYIFYTFNKWAPPTIICTLSLLCTSGY